MAARLFRESHATVIVFEEFAGRFGIVRDSMKLAGKEKSTAETESTHKSKTAAVAVLRPCAGMAGETGQLLQRRDSFDTTQRVRTRAFLHEDASPPAVYDRRNHAHAVRQIEHKMVEIVESHTRCSKFLFDRSLSSLSFCLSYTNSAVTGLLRMP